MSEPNEPTTPEAAPDAGTDPAAPTADAAPEAASEPEPDEGGSGNAEAARYRARLREAEAERDRLAARVSGYQLAEVSRIAGEQLSVGADLIEYGRAELADLLDEDGNVVAELVGTAVVGLLAERPGLGKPAKPKGPIMVGHHSGPPSGGGDWQSVLQTPGRY
jgi:hypothetical protein